MMLDHIFLANWENDIQKQMEGSLGKNVLIHPVPSWHTCVVLEKPNKVNELLFLVSRYCICERRYDLYSCCFLLTRGRTFAHGSLGLLCNSWITWRRAISSLCRAQYIHLDLILDDFFFLLNSKKGLHLLQWYCWRACFGQRRLHLFSWGWCLKSCCSKHSYHPWLLAWPRICYRKPELHQVATPLFRSL